MQSSLSHTKKSNTFAAANAQSLGYGVMVTLQILILSFLVRVQIAQHPHNRPFGLNKANGRLLSLDTKTPHALVPFS